MLTESQIIDTFLAAIKKHTALSPYMEETLLAHAVDKKINKDRNLSLYEGDHFFVAKGLLKKEHADTGDIAHFMSEGHFGIFPPEDDPYCFVSIEACTILIIRQENLDTILAQHKQLWRGYRHLLFEWAMQRIWRAELLLLPATSRKCELLARMGQLSNRIQNKDLANYININVSYYSRL